MGAVVALAAALKQVGALVDDDQGVAGQVVEEAAAGDEGRPEVGALGVASIGDFVERVEQFGGFVGGVGDAQVGQQVGGELARLGGDFAGRSERQLAEVVLRALRRGVEAAQAVDLVAEQLEADGGVGAGRPEVDDSAAHGVVGGLDDERAALVAAGFEGGDYALAGGALADGDKHGLERDGQRGLGDGVGVGDQDRRVASEGVERGEAGFAHIGVWRLPLVGHGLARRQGQNALNVALRQPDGQRFEQIGGVARAGGEDDERAVVAVGERGDYGGLGGVGHAERPGLAELGHLAGDRRQQRRE